MRAAPLPLFVGVTMVPDEPAVDRSDVVRIDTGGSVAFADRRDRAGLTGEACCSTTLLVCSPLGVRRVPIPGRGDHGGGALVPALRPLLPRRGRAARRNAGSRSIT